MTDDAKTAPADDAKTAPADDEAPDSPPAAAAEPEAAPDPAAERDEYRDLLLRKTAEFDNYRRRVERERAEFARAAAEDLILELLPLIDNLERALAVPAEGGSAESYRAGVDLIHRQLLDVLRKRDVTPIDAADAQFDPHVHEAVVHEASDDHEDGEVIEELRRGYRLGSRLLRPSMVRVAKA